MVQIQLPNPDDDLDVDVDVDVDISIFFIGKSIWFSQEGVEHFVVVIVLK